MLITVRLLPGTVPPLSHQKREPATVLDHVVAAALRQYVAVADQELAERVLWVLQRLGRFRNLVTVVHSRTAIAAEIEAWDNGFHQLVENLLADGLRHAGPSLSPIPLAERIIRAS